MAKPKVVTKLIRFNEADAAQIHATGARALKIYQFSEIVRYACIEFLQKYGKVKA